MTKERPILFSGTMVQALLDGRKTQTRRVVRPQPAHGVLLCPWVDTLWAEQDAQGGCRCHFAPVRNLYGQPGDRLWVRETWHLWGPPEHQILEYRADCADAENYTWRPSIFMPRRFSRITLEITDVRVERVRDISEADARAEGVTNADEGSNPIDGSHTIANFANLWEKINTKRDYGWQANPWVWVIGFKQVAL